MDTQPSRLTITETGHRKLAASGVIDSHTADIFSDRIEELGYDADVQLILSEVRFIDSSGLRTIVAAHQNFDEAGHRLVLTGLSEAVTRLVQITGLEDHLHTC